MNTSLLPALDGVDAGPAPLLSFKGALKSVVFSAGLAVMALPALTCWAEARLCREQHVFRGWGQVCALLPGLPGAYLRTCFYRLTLRRCALSANIGFLSQITSREAEIEEDVYIGPFAMIGIATLHRGALIGTRAGILNGGNQHARRADGTLAPFDAGSMTRTHVGAHSWIGEGAIVMADVGARCVVAAGAVVHRAVSDDCVVGGNPARFIRRTDIAA